MLVNGFKDGVVHVTGNSSKFTYCNNNLTQTNGVFYYNYKTLFSSDVVSVNFNPTNRDNSLTSFFSFVNDTLTWPYNTTFSCYWATTLLYEDYYTYRFPSVFNVKNEDGTWPILNFYEQALMNVIFNLGFIVSDFIWLINVTTAETDYWYRNGFVAGDIYMRLFYRTLYDVPAS